jgi:hypothetical protein
VPALLPGFLPVNGQTLFKTGFYLVQSHPWELVLRQFQYTKMDPLDLNYYLQVHSRSGVAPTSDIGYFPIQIPYGISTKWEYSPNGINVYKEYFPELGFRLAETQAYRELVVCIELQNRIRKTYIDPDIASLVLSLLKSE